MPSPHRWLRRRIDHARLKERKRELEREFTEHYGRICRFIPARAKGGYDEIYYAISGRKRIAVVRINSPHKQVNDPIGPLDPGVPLGPSQRLEREWRSYKILHPMGLSPEPIWRTHDCIACSWLPWQRASETLVNHHNLTWKIMNLSFQAIQRMHSAGVIHLDLNTGNLLFDEAGSSVVFIDFEFGPVGWVTLEQQMAFDYLRLIDDLVKPRRGGRVILQNAEEMVLLLNAAVPEGIRNAPLKFCFAKLQRLEAQTDICRILESVFPRLRA